MFSVGAVFWVIMLVWLAFGIFQWRGQPAGSPWVGPVGGLFPWVMFFLVGWKVFGWPISG